MNPSSPDDLAADLAWLGELGLVRGDDSGWETAAPVALLESQGVSDKCRHLVEAIRMLAGMANVRHPPLTSKLATARIKVEAGRGRAIMEKLLVLLQDESTDHLAGLPTEQVSFVVGISIS